MEPKCGPTTSQFCQCGRVMKNGCPTNHCKKCIPHLADGVRRPFPFPHPISPPVCKCPKCPKCKHYGETEELVQTQEGCSCACRACIHVHRKVGGPCKPCAPGTYRRGEELLQTGACPPCRKLKPLKPKCGPTTRQFCRCGRVMKNGCPTNHCKKCKKPKCGPINRKRCPCGRVIDKKGCKTNTCKKCKPHLADGVRRPFPRPRPRPRRLDGGRGRYFERMRKKRCASKWRCGVSGLSTPVAINARTGDVQCMSTNGRDCWWGRCRGRKVPRHGRLKPLVCGAHHKKKWGGTGYNNKHHWCNKVKKPVAKRCKKRARARPLRLKRRL